MVTIRKKGEKVFIEPTIETQTTIDMSALQTFTKSDNLEYLAESVLEQMENLFRNILDTEEEVVYNGDQDFLRLLESLIEFYRKYKERD